MKTREPNEVEVERRVATRKLWIGVAVLAYYVLNSVRDAHVCVDACRAERFHMLIAFG